MITIVQRSDLSRMYHDLEADKVRPYHFGISTETTQKSELIVFIDDSEVYVLQADKWPYSESMSADDLLKYIANHVA